MNLYVGTSGYAYKPWKGSFYPEDLPDKMMLRYYGEHFRAVEINNTFYRMPRESVLEKWGDDVPYDFKFAVKAPQRITHFQRLKNTDNSLSYFLKVVGALGERLGPLLFQTPPNFERNTKRLSDFLKALPRWCHAAFEFRHESWFVQETFDLLHEHRAALCVAEADNHLQVPFIGTTDWGYLRLRRLDYTDADLARWAERIRGPGWNEVFAFFKHEEAGIGPQLASRFLELAARRPARGVASPVAPSKDVDHK